MSNLKKIPDEELNKLPKNVITMMYSQLSDSFDVLQEQNKQLLKQIASLQESLAVMNQRLFGKKSEKNLSCPGQLSFDFDLNILNEAEQLTEQGIPEEPSAETVIKEHTRKKSKGKRAEDLSLVERTIVEHTLSDEQLANAFPEGYTRLPDETYTDLEYVPAKVIAVEHHVAVYVSKGSDHTFLRGDRVPRLLGNSILTPSLAAGIADMKYVNQIPIKRIATDFQRMDVNISSQVMSGWMIKIADRFLRAIYNRMKKAIIKSLLIHCDETPFRLTNNARENPDGTMGENTSSKSYMWVYHSDPKYEAPNIFLYEYQLGRETSHPREFLKGYKGILMTDGYQVYHTLQNERPDELIVSGCWAHAKRKYAEIIKAMGEKGSVGSVAEEGNKRIMAIYHVDNMTKGKSNQEILDNRRVSVKPLVDSYFAWAKSVYSSDKLDKAGKAYKAVQYSVNQEEFLRRFLENPIIPLDNNDAERSIRSFCVGKHSWHLIDSKKGAEASAILYSIAETAKANGLKPYEYFKYSLEELLMHQDDPLDSYIDAIMPWSESLPESCRKIK